MAEYAILFSARSRRDLNAIQRWLGQPGSGLKARLKIARISRAIAELRYTPERWPIGEHSGARQRPVEGHTIIYRVDERLREVRIVRVFGPFQDRATL